MAMRQTAGAALVARPLQALLFCADPTCPMRTAAGVETVEVLSVEYPAPGPA